MVASVLFYAAHFYWGGSIRNKGAKRLDKLVKKAVIGAILGEMVERCTLNPLEAILNNSDHPLYNIFMEQKNMST